MNTDDRTIDELISDYAERLQEIYDDTLAGEHTFTGVLAEAFGALGGRLVSAERERDALKAENADLRAAVVSSDDMVGDFMAKRDAAEDRAEAAEAQLEMANTRNRIWAEDVTAYRAVLDRVREQLGVEITAEPSDDYAKGFLDAYASIRALLPAVQVGATSGVNPGGRDTTQTRQHVNPGDEK